MEALTQYIYNVLLSIDQLFNTVFLLGDPDLSISSHCALALYLESKGTHKAKWFVEDLAKIIDFIFYQLVGEKNHVLNALEINEKNHKALWQWYKKTGVN